MRLNDLDPEGDDLTVIDLALRVDVDTRTVYRWLESGMLLGSYKVANTWRIPQRVVLDRLISIPSESTVSPE